MASLVDSLATGAGGPAFTNPMGQVTQQTDQGTQNAIALGGQYLQAKQLEATVNFHKAQIDNQWQEREDSAWKTLYDQSANGANSKQIANIAGSINKIRQMRGNGTVMNPDQLQDVVDTFSTNPDFGAKAAQLQSMMVDSISSGKPIDPKFAQLYQEIRSTPGIAAATRMKEIETGIQSYQTARGQEMRSNVGQQGKSAQDVISDTMKMSDDLARSGKDPASIIGKQNAQKLATLALKGNNISDEDAAFVQSVKPALQSAMAQVVPEKRNYDESNNLYKEAISTARSINDKDVNGKFTPQVSSLMSKLEAAKNDPEKIKSIQTQLSGLEGRTSGEKFQTEQGNKYNEEINKRQDTLVKQLAPYDKINEDLNDKLSKLQTALSSNASASETRQQVGTLVSAIEGAKGQTNKYKMSLALPTTYGTDLKNWWQTKVVGGTSDFDPGEKQKYQQLYNDVKSSHVQAMGRVADQLQSYGKNAKDKWSKDAWGPHGGNTQTIKDWKTNLSSTFGAGYAGSQNAAKNPQSGLITMPSGKKYTPAQVQQMLPQMNPDAQQKWKQYLQQLGGQQ